MNELKVVATGVSPLLMHSDRLSNPLDKDAQALKQITSKRKKTDEDHLEIQKGDWMGGLYWDKDLGPYIPGVNIKSCIVGGAKLNKLGTAVKRGVVVLEEKCPLEYKGPRDPEKLYKNPRYIDTRSVVVSNSRLMRTRPIFPEWELHFSLMFSDEIINLHELKQVITNAGNFIGLGDYRPDKGGPFGRFESKF